MAGSRRSLPAEPVGRGVPGLRSPVLAAVDAALSAHVAPGTTVAVALSGGRDSVALLDACVTLASTRGTTVASIHVHHGLSPSADAWQSFCEARCREVGIALEVRRIEVPRNARDGIEATARERRYQVLADAARQLGAGIVLLAHHQDDQAETLLLQLARGAGPHGLRGMPVVDRSRDINWLRPLLDVPRREIEAYVASRDLRFVDDPSNIDPRHRRNAVRMEVAPAIARNFPGYPHTLARAAALQAESAQLLDDLAALDGEVAVEGGSLDRHKLAVLPQRRARNLLRWFLRQNGLRAPSAARLADMLRQLATAARDAEVRIVHDGRALGVHRGRIVVHELPPPQYEIPWHGETELALPHGRLRFVPCEGEGLAMDRIVRASTSVRTREGGERIRLVLAGPSRSLKHLLQEAGVPHWDRSAWPLVFCDGVLAAVPGIGVDAAWRAAASAPGVIPMWSETRREPGRLSR